MWPSKVLGLRLVLLAEQGFKLKEFYHSSDELDIKTLDKFHLVEFLNWLGY